jgi:hypothetical protein
VHALHKVPGLAQYPLDSFQPDGYFDRIVGILADIQRFAIDVALLDLNHA